ncbi:MAG: TPM domain-containing protein [Oscillospiraceae bacterium]|nr:TPM domain-containing protein [Oscillospiraceae bacterium]
MKQKLRSLFMGLCLIIGLAVPALAASNYGLVYDATDLLDGTFLSDLNDNTFTPLGEQYGMEVRIDVVTKLEGESIEAYAQIFYDQYEYGYGDTTDGVLLMLLLHEDDTGLAFDAYHILAGGKGTEMINDQVRQKLEKTLDETLNEAAWSGPLQQDERACEQAFTDYGRILADTFSAGTVSAGQTPAAASVENTLPYVTDSAGLLSTGEVSALEENAQNIAQQYGCGVYAITMEDYTDYTEKSIYEYAKDIYRSYDLGWGTNKDGILLLLSMAERDYALIAYGDFANAAFTDHGKSVLENTFLDDFRDNDWYDGFEDYQEKSAEMLEMARNGEPLDVDNDKEGIQLTWGESIAGGILAGCVISLIVCLVFKKQMKSARTQVTAREYVPKSGVAFRAVEDYYLHTTQTRRTVKSHSSGGTSIDSDGFSGHSGKF